MDTAMDQDQIEKMLDQAVREVTEKAVGVQLHQGPLPPAGEMYSVHITFKKGFQSSLTLYADAAMLARMARKTVGSDSVTAQDMEDAGKEYFNILCGRIAGLLYKATKVPARFDVPTFHRGRFDPKDQRTQFVLNYVDDQREGAQLIHHVPCHRVDTTE